MTLTPERRPPARRLCTNPNQDRRVGDVGVQHSATQFPRLMGDVKMRSLSSRGWNVVQKATEINQPVAIARKSQRCCRYQFESVPEVSAKLKAPKTLQTAIPKFEDVVKSAEEAAVLVLVY